MFYVTGNKRGFSGKPLSFVHVSLISNQRKSFARKDNQFVLEKSHPLYESFSWFLEKRFYTYTRNWQRLVGSDYDCRNCKNISALIFFLKNIDIIIHFYLIHRKMTG